MGLSKDNRFCYSLNAYTRHEITVVVVRTETRTGIRYEGTHTERCLRCGKVTEVKGETFRAYDHLTRPSEATMARWNAAYREFALELFGTGDRGELTDYEDARLVELADGAAFAA